MSAVRPGAAAGIDARRALDVARRGRGADRRADHRRGAVGHQGAMQARHGAVGPHEAAAMGERDQGAGIVEQIDEQEGEDHRHQSDLEGAGEVHLQEHRCDRRRHVDDAGEFLLAGDDRHDRHRQDADDHAAHDPAMLERHDQDKAQRRHDDRPARELAVRDQGRRMPTTMPAFLSAISARNKPMPAAIAILSDLGMALTIHSRIGSTLMMKKMTPEMNTQPSATCQRYLHAAHHGEGEVGVEPHARRQRDRVVGEERHQEAADGGGHAGRDEHRAERHAGLAEDRPD